MVKAGLVQSAIVDVKVLRHADREHERWLRAFMEYLLDNQHDMRYAPGEIHCPGGIVEIPDIVVKRRTDETTRDVLECTWCQRHPRLTRATDESVGPAMPTNGKSERIPTGFRMQPVRAVILDFAEENINIATRLLRFRVLSSLRLLVNTSRGCRSENARRYSTHNRC